LRSGLAYGEVRAFDRLAAVVEAHLGRLAAAGAGEEAGFGIDLTGGPDLERIVMAGHGLGADGALGFAASDARAPQVGRAPVRALLLIAPVGQPQSTLRPQSEPASISVSSVNSVTVSLPDVPIGVILPECDGIGPELAGARIYEAARLAGDRGSLTEVRTNLLDGPAQIVPPAEVTFCPGDPAAKSLRAAADPADPRNWSGPDSPFPHFSVILRDTVGRVAIGAVPAGISALYLPAGRLRAQGEISLWTGFTPLSSIRIPLSAFEGIDLAHVTGLAFSSGDSESGAIRIADLEFVAR
jgi:hypothetical protein